MMNNDAAVNNLMIQQDRKPGGAIETTIGRSVDNNQMQHNPDFVDAMTRSGVTQVNIGGDNPGYNVHQTTTFSDAALESPFQGDILSTLRNPSGSKIMDPAAITDNSVVNIKGISTTVGSAIRAGLLSRDGQGNLIDPSNQGRSSYKAMNDPAPNQQQTKANTRVVDFKTPRSKEILSAVSNKLGVTKTDALVSRILGDMTASERADSMAGKELAGLLGIEPVQAKSLVEKVANDIFDNAKTFTTRNKGVDGEALFDWVLEECSPAYRASVMNRLYYNDLSVVDEVIKAKRLGNRY